MLTAAGSLNAMLKIISVHSRDFRVSLNGNTSHVHSTRNSLHEKQQKSNTGDAFVADQRSKAEWPLTFLPLPSAVAVITITC